MPETELLGAPAPLSEPEWKEIALGIRQGDCVLVLGPAIAIDLNDQQHIPLSTMLARALAKRLKDKTPNYHIVNEDDLSHVSQLFSDQEGRRSLSIEVDEFYTHYDATTTPLHRELADLPFQLVINTTPDSFMETAFKEVGKRPQVEYYDLQRGHKRDISLSSDEPLVFDLYGSRRDLDSLILTESDLLDFLIHIIREEPPLPKAIHGLLAQPSTTFLFVGFGFQKWHVRILLRSLQAQRPQSRSFALESPEFFKYHDLPATIVFFESQRLIGFRLFSWEQFMTELKQHHDALVRKPTIAEPTLPETAPLVFLSYFHQDKQTVSTLERQLHERGIRTWRDSHNLRGGDVWLEMIEAVLGACNYVVVIQSSYGDQQAESYVHWEIKQALDRQKRFAPGFRFLIPTKIDSCRGFSNLQHLQFIDVSIPGGVAELATAVQADWARRTPKAVS